MDRPADPIAGRVFDVWSAVLEGRRFQTTDTFFDAGGNSILLVVLAQQLSEAFARPVEVSELLRRPSVEAQAEMFAQRPAAEDTGAAGGPVDAAVEAGRSRARARRARR